MSDPNQTTNFAPDDGLSVTATGQITVAIVILAIVLTIAILVLYLRNKGYTGAIVSSRRSRRLVFAPNEPTVPRNALDQSILDSLPVTVYQSVDHSEGLECAVCICELTDREEARFLPKCNHAFHVGCIDMWFHSNSTCPLCRVPVQSYSATNDKAVAVEIPVRPSQAQGSSSSCSSSGKRELVIEIPRRVMEGFSTPRSALPSSKLSVERIKSPALRSLRRMMSRGRGKEVSSSCTPQPAFDIEEGGIRDLKQQ